MSATEFFRLTVNALTAELTCMRKKCGRGVFYKVKLLFQTNSRVLLHHNIIKVQTHDLKYSSVETRKF